MSKRLNRTLLAAADSHARSQPEDRLTEILREVLLTAPLLAARLAERAFGLARGSAEAMFVRGPYDVDTQFELPGGGRPDMRVEAAGLPGELYIENKLWASWTQHQKDGYPAISGRCRVMTITTGRPGPRALPERERAKFVDWSWMELASNADAIGRTWGRAGWREKALRPDAPAQFRLLAELIAYLEREDAAVTIAEPLNEGDLAILPQVHDSRARWKQFCRLVRAETERRATVLEVKKRARPDEVERQDPLALRLRLSRADGWAGAEWPALGRLPLLQPPKRSYRELILSPGPRWMDQDRPLIAAGTAFYGLPDWPEEAREWLDLCSTLRAQGAWIGATERGKVLRILQVRALAELLDPDVTLEQQAATTAEWGLAAIDQLTRVTATVS